MSGKTSRLRGRLGSHVVSFYLLAKLVVFDGRRGIRLVVEGFCKLLVLPWIFGGMQSIASFSILFSILPSNKSTLLLVVSLRIE